MPEPGDASEEAKAEQLLRLHRLAVEKFGEERAAAVESSLKQAAASIARLELLRFSRDDSPAFYLQDMADASERPGD